MGEVNTDNNLEKFAFSVPAEKNGQEVIFVPRNGRTQKFSSSKIALKLPTLGSTDTDPEPTTAPSVPDGSKVENSITAEKADGSAFTMFNVEKSTATVHGENINIELYLKANASGKSHTPVFTWEVKKMKRKHRSLRERSTRITIRYTNSAFR